MWGQPGQGVCLGRGGRSRGGDQWKNLAEAVHAAILRTKGEHSKK